MELRDDFDSWAQAIIDGERDVSFSPEEFMIQCVETGESCNVNMLNGKVQLVCSETGRMISSAECDRINRTGLFCSTVIG